MKTAKQIIAETLARNPSNEDVYPKLIAHVEYSRDDLLAALSPVKDSNPRAAELFAGVSAASAGKTVAIQREHLLEALGALPSDPPIDQESKDGIADESAKASKV